MPLDELIDDHINLHLAIRRLSWKEWEDVRSWLAEDIPDGDLGAFLGSARGLAIIGGALLRRMKREAGDAA